MLGGIGGRRRRGQQRIHSPEGEETLRPPRSDLRSPGKISKLGGFHAPDGDSTRVRERERHGVTHGPQERVGMTQCRLTPTTEDRAHHGICWECRLGVALESLQGLRDLT